MNKKVTDVLNKNKYEYLQKIFILMLFVLYVLILTWGILLKFQFDVSRLQNVDRHLELVTKPFFLKDSQKQKFDILANILAFIPFGVYLMALRNKMNRGLHTALCAAAMMLTSFLYEYIQFVYGIGCSDINDCICNTLGGVIGIIIYYIVYAVLRKRTNTIITAAACVFTVISAAVLAFTVMTDSSDELYKRVMNTLQHL